MPHLLFWGVYFSLFCQEKWKTNGFHMKSRVQLTSLCDGFLDMSVFQATLIFPSLPSVSLVPIWALNGAWQFVLCFQVMHLSFMPHWGFSLSSSYIPSPDLGIELSNVQILHQLFSAFNTNYSSHSPFRKVCPSMIVLSHPTSFPCQCCIHLLQQ